VAVREAMGRGEGVIPFAAFAEVVERLVAGLRVREALVTPGTVCVATPDEATGARVRFVIMANLVEGTFPTREAVEEADRAGGPSRAYRREMARFLRALGSADQGVVLVRPTRDEKGQELLAAGFLDELSRRIERTAVASISEELNQIDPALIGHPDLALAPA